MKKETYIVALLLPNTIYPFFSSFAHYINIALMKRKYRMLLCVIYDNFAGGQLAAEKSCLPSRYIYLRRNHLGIG